MAARECPNCKVKLDPNYAFCPECGAPVPSAPPPEPPKPAPEPAPEPPRKAAPPAAERKAAGGARFRLVRLARGGGQAAEHDLPDAGLVVGRTEADLPFGDDDTISPRHVELKPAGSRVELSDLGSLNGVYLRIKGEQRLVDGDAFVCGDSVFRVSLEPGRFDPVEYRLFASPQEKPILATVTRILADGRDGEVFAVRTLPFVFGREEGDIRCGADRFMSRKHAAFQNGSGGLVLVDLKSRNGTYVRRRGSLSLVDGDVFMVGRQLLRIEAVPQ